MDGLVDSGTVVGEARLIADVVRKRLVELAIPGDLSLTGSSSILGLLTKADVDLHGRTSGQSFEGGWWLRLRRSFPVAEPDAWAPALAVFDVPGTGRPTGLAVTPVESEHDRRFTLAWTQLPAGTSALALVPDQHHLVLPPDLEQLGGLDQVAQLPVAVVARVE